MMRQCGNEHYGIEMCEKCGEASTCTAVKSTQENADYFRKAAKQDFLSSPLSSEQGFNGYGKNDSSRPPKEKSDYISDMRANPKYIRYLYAAKEKYTAMLETRPNIGSFVSVANIKTLSPLKFFDITNVGESTNEDMSLLLFELNNVFSTPVNGELKDYLLSQVLSEYIKCFDNATRFDGICYMSSMDSMGKNCVIFGEDKCIPVSSEVYYISKIGLTAYSVTEEDEKIIDNTNRI